MNDINLWNRKNLEPPPIASYKTNSLSVDLCTLRNILKEALYIFKNQSIFDKEAAFLSRFIYCSKTKLRHNKAIKVLQKINQALLRYLRMNLVKHVQIFLDMIPYNNNELYLPTRSMLQYLLVRLQGTAKLMVRIVETSKIAAYILNQHINIGHLWKMLFLSFGMVSRIYVLAKNLAKSCCTLYTQLLPFTKSLEDLNYHWLPTDYILPNDLKQWLNTDCLDNNSLQDSDVTDGLSYLSLLNNLDGDEWFEQSINVNIHKVENNENSEIKILEEDFGVPIDEIKISKKKRRIKGMEASASLDGDEWFEESNVNIKKICVTKVDNNDNTTVNIVKEDIGVAINETKTSNKKRRNDIEASAPLKKSKLADTINSIVDLKKFQSDFKQNTEKYTDNFKKIDRIQCHMLKKSLCKYMKKIDKNLHDSVKVSEYLVQVKKLLECL